MEIIFQQKFYNLYICKSNISALEGYFDLDIHFLRFL